MPWVAKDAPMKVKLKEPHGGRGPRRKRYALLGEEKATSNQLLNMESMEIPLKTGRIENQEAGKIFLLNQSP